MQAYRGSKSIALLILDHGATWMWAVKFTPWSLYPRKGTTVPIELEAWWAPEPVFTFLRRENSGIRSWIRNPDRPATMYQDWCVSSKRKLVMSWKCFIGEYCWEFWPVKIHAEAKWTKNNFIICTFDWCILELNFVAAKFEKGGSFTRITFVGAR